MRDARFYILSMVTDLRRASYCLFQKSEKNAVVFLNHCKKICDEDLLILNGSRVSRLIKEFHILYNEKEKRCIEPLLFADKLMTLSSRLQFSIQTL
jgi:hypothetical protein